MDNKQRVQRLQAAIDNKPFNTPIPRLTISQRDELKALVDAGRIDDALGELTYLSNVAWGHCLENMRTKSSEQRLQLLKEELLRAKILKAKFATETLVATTGCEDGPPERELKKVRKLTRKDNLRLAIDAVIKSFGSKPSLDELWQFFQDDKDETGFIVDFADTHITWTDIKGKLHDTSKESLANRLSRIKS